MWWAGKSRAPRSDLDVYLTRRGFAVGEGDKRIVAQDAVNEVDALSQLGTWLQQRARPSELSVYLSAAICRPLHGGLPPLPEDEARVATQALVHRKLSWTEEVELRWLGEKGPQGQLGAAIPVALLERVKALGSTTARARLRRVTGSWAACLAHQARVQPEAGGLTLVEDDAVTLAVQAPSGDVTVVCGLVSAGVDASQVRARLASALNVPDSSPCLELSRHSTSSPANPPTEHPMMVFVQDCGSGTT